jgi:hypothetical protein
MLDNIKATCLPYKVQGSMQRNSDVLHQKALPTQLTQFSKHYEIFKKCGYIAYIYQKVMGS